jgi:hypothetical protein
MSEAMTNKHEIKSEKILVKDIFSSMWFRDEVNELLDDLAFAKANKPDQEYFLGSFVFQDKKANATPGQEFDENGLLDGQQRMTTLQRKEFASVMTSFRPSGFDCQNEAFINANRTNIALT